MKPDLNHIFPDNRFDFDTPLEQTQAVLLRMLRIVDYICKKHDIQYWLVAGTLRNTVLSGKFSKWDDDIDLAMMREDFISFLKYAQKDLPDSLVLQHTSTEPYYGNPVVPMKIRDKNSIFLERNENGLEPYSHGIFLDIFAYDHLPENKLKRYMLKQTSKFILKLRRKATQNHNYNTRSFPNRVFSRILPLKTLNSVIEYLVHTQNSTGIIGIGYDSIKGKDQKYSDIFPLKKLSFESYDFYVPHQYNKVLKNTYGENYNKLPNKKKPSHISKLIIDTTSDTVYSS